MSEPRVLTRTVAASFATTSGLGVIAAGFDYVVDLGEFGAGFVAFGGGEGVGEGVG